MTKIPPLSQRALTWLLPALGLALLAWALRIYRLDAQSFWYDEGYSVFTAALPPAEMVRWTAGDFTPPLYNYLLHLWLPLAGWSEFAARFLSICAGTLTVAVLVRMGRDLHSRLGGLLAGLLAACAPFAVWHSQDARTFALPTDAQPVTYHLGEAISLLGTRFSTTRNAAGVTAEVVLYWQAQALVESPYTVFVHLVGPDGQLHDQADGPPQEGRHPTTHWLPGEVVADPRRLVLPADAPPGTYRVLVGLYDPATMDRLAASDGAGNPLPDNTIPVGSFEVP